MELLDENTLKQRDEIRREYPKAYAAYLDEIKDCPMKETEISIISEAMFWLGYTKGIEK